jgi:hypothetical protein
MLEVAVGLDPLRVISAGSVVRWVIGPLTAACPEVEMTTVEVVEEEAPPAVVHPVVMEVVVVVTAVTAETEETMVVPKSSERDFASFARSVVT